MKMPYKHAEVLIEALTELDNKYEKDIQDVTDEHGAIKLDVPSEYISLINSKQSVIRDLVRRIKTSYLDI